MRISPDFWVASGNKLGIEENPSLAQLYSSLLGTAVELETQREALAWLEKHIHRLDMSCSDLPVDPQNLNEWMRSSAQFVASQYAEYLQQRKDGGSRRYFSNRAHALYFLKAAAPTKLVDGAWLHGLLKHWRNTKFAGLVRIYIEELGDGNSGKNHVVIYKSLLARYGLDLPAEFDEDFYTQGLIQLTLASNADHFLPEVIGFNLGYEQLPLHLLITAYELNELGIDPYYFTLHVTVDNPDTGHAQRAVQAVLDNLPRLGCAKDFWQRVQVGYQLSNAGLGTQDIIDNFDINVEVTRIFQQKSSAGHNAHSDYCRVAGRHVNDWLSSKENIPEFLIALQKSNWIVRGAPVCKSRFWNLLRGKRAEMFGVFTSYELQVIHDWIRGSDSSDGQSYDESESQRPPAAAINFRTTQRQIATRGNPPHDFDSDTSEKLLLDADLQILVEKLLAATKDGQETMLVEVMSPAHHWTPAGLFATRMFNDMIM